KVIGGGNISEGRNKGGSAAKGDILIFIDADTILTRPDFLEKVIKKFEDENADIATCYLTNSKDKNFAFITSLRLQNFIKWLNQPLSLFLKDTFGIIGIFIICKASLF